MHLTLTGAWLDAAGARQLGLVASVVAPRRLRAAALTRARRLARLDGQLVSSLKRAIDDGRDLPLAAALALERRLVCAAASA
jgi:enoyl-CoA hydratase/carnithine racemase